jgi:O-succinylbenzoate synthase
MLDSLELFLYCIPGLTFFKQRKGILIRTNSENWAEASPLPLWSKETIQDVIKELLAIKSGKHLATLSSSVSFALSSLEKKKSVTQAIPLAALLTGSPKDIESQAKQAQKLGITTAKIKISALEKEDARALLTELKQTFRLRVDCNKKWDLYDALDFFESFTLTDFDFIEEPLKKPSDLLYFTHPFALDESLMQLPYWSAFPKLKTIVIKPSLIGSMETIYQLATQAKKLKKEVVISSIFETEIGLFHLSQLANDLAPHTAHGFGTYAFLHEPILEEQVTIANGKMWFPLNIKPKASKLTPIKHIHDDLPNL